MKDPSIQQNPSNSNLNENNFKASEVLTTMHKTKRQSKMW